MLANKKVRAVNINFNKLYLSKAKSAARKLSRIGSVLLVGVSGSLARGSAEESSDIDLFVVSRAGRIFTTRFLSKMILGRSARRNRDKKPAGKICLNYFLSEESLDFKPHNDYVVEDYKNAIILFTKGDIIDRLIKANKWLNPRFKLHKIICHSREGGNPLINRVDSRLRGNDTDKNGSDKRPLRNYKGEIRGDKGGTGSPYSLGNLLESALRHLQVRKIKRDPRTQKYPQKIVFSDLELRFHPPKGED